MTFPQTLAATVVLLLVLLALLAGLFKLCATAGDTRWDEYRRAIAEDTPEHEYTNHDGTKGTWP